MKNAGKLTSGKFIISIIAIALISVTTITAFAIQTQRPKTTIPTPGLTASPTSSGSPGGTSTAPNLPTEASPSTTNTESPPISEPSPSTTYSSDTPTPIPTASTSELASPTPSSTATTQTTTPPSGSPIFPSPTSTITSVPTSLPTPPTSLPLSEQVYSNGQYRILAWNDLGMHCYNPSFRDIGVLPPYNTLWAQVIRIGEEPRIVTSGITVSYFIIDNTYSAGKTDFWNYEDKLFGVNLPDNIGLAGKGLSGTMDISGNHFIGEGIPLTEYRDQDVSSAPQSEWNRYPYMLAVITATDSNTGSILARTTVTAPVSTEMRCDTCHSDTGQATTKFPIEKTGNVDTNILALHDYLHPQTPPLLSSRPVLCAKCHGSNALGITGNIGVPALSNAMHSNHVGVTGITPDTSGCYSCHPGEETKCFRGVMAQQGLTCITCHGTLSMVAQNPNPWLNEPKCDSANCHPSSVRLNNPLFRLSTAMGGIYCEGCHGSTHGILPTTQYNDHIQILGLQSSAGPLNDCTVCHGQNMGGGNPHFAEDSFRPDVLLMIVLPFSVVSSTATAFMVYRKKHWKTSNLRL